MVEKTEAEAVEAVDVEAAGRVEALVVVQPEEAVAVEVVAVEAAEAMRVVVEGDAVVVAAAAMEQGLEVALQPEVGDDHRLAEEARLLRQLVPHRSTLTMKTVCHSFPS